MGKRKILRRLERDFGAVPNVHYFAGDMENITSYFDYRRENGLDDYLLDETTWYDLEMDGIFKRINPGLTTSGEQYLYYMLRHPATTKEDFDGRRALISEMRGNPPLRLKLQYILNGLGRSRSVVMEQAFNPEQRGPGWLVVFTLLCLILLACIIIGTFINPIAWVPAAALVIINTALHGARVNKLGRDFETVNYSFSMIVTLEKVRRLKAAALSAQLSRAFESLDRFQSALRMGSIPGLTGNDLSQVAVNIFLLDLIAYEFLKNKLWRNHDDLFTVHEALGKIDAAIAVASFMKSTPGLCKPELDFSGDAQAYIEASQMVHPLMTQPVPNDLLTSSPVLLTGSNASGKSTYIKTAALCAILAQSICVTTAKSYKASAFRILTSMAVTDNLTAGESYYIVEIKSLKRIFDAAGASTGPILAVIDEVLRGTNTVERIAASAEILHALAKRAILCLAATHDIELCTLLNGEYGLYHFEETVGNEGMIFDYKLRHGPAGSRNAINLLKLIGFDEVIVRRAHERADNYMDSGVWSV